MMNYIILHRIVDNYVNLNSIYNSGEYQKIDSLNLLLPHPNLRISIIDTIRKGPL